MTKAICKALQAMAALLYAIDCCLQIADTFVSPTGLLHARACLASVPFVLICHICSNEQEMKRPRVANCCSAEKFRAMGR